jgi:hypothetical protein
MKTGPKPKPTEERFWPRVVVGEPDECWEWQGARDWRGYGRTWHQPIRRSTAAHRVAYELVNGLIPAGLCVLHSCDNPPCCNPAHLRVGTVQDNSDDMVERGRQKKPGYSSKLRGELHHRAMAKLTVDQVREIRRIYSEGGISMRALSFQFDVTPPTVRNIVLRISWPHIN